MILPHCRSSAQRTPPFSWSGFWRLAILTIARGSPKRHLRPKDHPLTPVIRFAIAGSARDIMMEYSRNRPSSRDSLSDPSTPNRGRGRPLWVRRSPIEFRRSSDDLREINDASVLIQYERHKRERTDIDSSVGTGRNRDFILLSISPIL